MANREETRKLDTAEELEARKARKDENRNPDAEVDEELDNE